MRSLGLMLVCVRGTIQKKAAPPTWSDRTRAKELVGMPRKHLPGAGLMLVQRLRRWPNINPAPVFTGVVCSD